MLVLDKPTVECCNIPRLFKGPFTASRMGAILIRIQPSRKTFFPLLNTGFHREFKLNFKDTSDQTAQGAVKKSHIYYLAWILMNALIRGRNVVVMSQRSGELANAVALAAQQNGFERVGKMNSYNTLVYERLSQELGRMRRADKARSDALVARSIARAPAHTVLE